MTVGSRLLVVGRSPIYYCGTEYWFRYTLSPPCQQSSVTVHCPCDCVPVTPGTWSQGRWEKVAEAPLLARPRACGTRRPGMEQKKTKADKSQVLGRIHSLVSIVFAPFPLFCGVSSERYRRRSSSREQRLFLASMTSRDPTRWAPGMQRRRWRRWGTLFRMPSCSTCSAPTTARKGSRAAVLPSLFGTCLRRQHLTLAWAQVGVVREISPDVRHRPDRRRR